MVISLNPLAYKNSSKSSGNILTFLMLPIGMEVVCDKVTPNNEPLAINVNLPSCDKNLSRVSRAGYACISSIKIRVSSFCPILFPASILT